MDERGVSDYTGHNSWLASYRKIPIMFPEQQILYLSILGGTPLLNDFKLKVLSSCRVSLSYLLFESLDRSQCT